MTSIGDRVKCSVLEYCIGHDWCATLKLVQDTMTCLLVVQSLMAAAASNRRGPIIPSSRWGTASASFRTRFMCPPLWEQAACAPQGQHVGAVVVSPPFNKAKCVADAIQRSAKAYYKWSIR